MARRELFAALLLQVVPNAVEYRQIALPDNSEVKRATADLKKINAAVSRFLDKVKASPFLSDIEQHLILSRGFDADVELISKYFNLFSDFVGDTYAATQRTRRNDPTAMAVCQFICRAYEKCFGEKPGVYDGDRIGQSEDQAEGTPYERVCCAVARKFNMELPWATQKQATKTYQRGLVDFSKVFPDDKVTVTKGD